MRFPILSLLFLSGSLAAVAGDPPERKTLMLRSAPSEITVDGVMEQAWSAADSATGFFQLLPYYRGVPKYRTVARLLTTTDALYCLILCEEPPEEIEAHPGILDQFSGDMVSLMIDTFDDRQTAYKFAVSSSGVRSDCRLLDDARNRDYSWDGVWFAASRRYAWGFLVEMRIPYRSIRYDGTLASWGLDFDRWIPATREDLYWNEYEQSEGQRISKFGRLELNGTRPTAEGLNLEIYPVGIAKGTYEEGKTHVEPEAGIDLFYNPSEKLTLQLTANPDFAQIEADPFQFNISRYESYFEERRPFFTEGAEIFMASGRQQNTGFYRPLDLFYSRRIGRILEGGERVPLYVGTKASGRADEWQYGGFYALTGETGYMHGDSTPAVEEQAHFMAARVKKQILENSSIGALFVGKVTPGNIEGVIDVDGAFRTSVAQLSYQIARSVKNGTGDFALSAGLTDFGESWWNALRVRAIGKDFDVNAVGFVPWQGTVELTGLTGPAWYFNEGSVQQFAIYAGGTLMYEDADLYTDRVAVLGFNLNFRTNWGMELNLSGGQTRDQGVDYTSWEVNYSTWFHTSPRWEANAALTYGKRYNFTRDFLARFFISEGEVAWKPFDVLEIGSSLGAMVEGNPAGGVEEVTYNGRPFFSLTPVNDLNIRCYVDLLYLDSSERLQQVFYGLLVSYNFLPKSWIYFAVNELQQRENIQDQATVSHLATTDRAAVLKIKYLYYL
jgi:hypothetical protein